MFHWELIGYNFNLFFDTNLRSLPLEGWIHPCISCTTPTGNYFNYYHNANFDISISICSHCIRNNYIPHRGIIEQINLKFDNLLDENN